MKRLIAPAGALVAALVISACGGGGGGGSSASSGQSGAAADAVSLHNVSGIGQVLVDGSGKAVYASDVEASGKIACTGPCMVFWKPVTAASGAPKGSSGTGKLGVIKRPDGARQLTANGRPLYTFSEDSPGQVTGDGFKDAFSGKHFTWHVMRSGGKTGSGGGAAATPSGSGYGGY